MNRPLAWLAFVLVLVALAGCAGSLNPTAELASVTLSVSQQAAIGAQGVPTDASGASAVHTFEIAVFDRHGAPVSFDGDGTYDPDGDTTTLELAVGDAGVTLRLPTGRYTFRTYGLSATGEELLAYGQTTADVTHQSTSLKLDVFSLIGEAELRPEGLRHYIVPGEVLDLYLFVSTVGGVFRVPLGDYTVEYALDGDQGELVGSAVGVRVKVTTSPTQDVFKITAKVRGWSLKNGQPKSQVKISASFQRPFLQTSGITVDTERPTVTFDPPAPAAPGVVVTLSGTANDLVGVDRVLVFEGPVLIGSTATEDVEAGAARITFTDTATGAWQMSWLPPVDGPGPKVFSLRAVAIDTSGNDASAEAELTVGSFAPSPPTIGELQSLSSGEPLAEALGNCAATELELPGQGLQAVGAGLQAVGAVGGLFLGPTASFDGRLVTPQTVAGEVDDVATGHAAYYNVAGIMLVDDFAGRYELPAELFAAGLTQAQLEDLVATGEISHGALVLHHLLSMLDAVGYGPMYEKPNGVTGEPLYVYASEHKGTIVVQTLDTAGHDTAEIVKLIRKSFEYVSLHGEYWVPEFVLNMSFAVVPCAVAADLGASLVDTFEEYVQALRELNGIGAQYEDELATLLTTPLGAEDDPLLAFLDCPLPVKHKNVCNGYSHYDGAKLLSLVNVASAGNLGHDFALYPAAWPTVISVSSQDVAPGGYSAERSGYANSGEVLAPGAFFELSEPGSGTTLAYAGTSFSAPVVTLFTALDLMRDRLCEPGEISRPAATAPALAYGANDDVPLDSVFGNADSAIATYCQE